MSLYNNGDDAASIPDRTMAQGHIALILVETILHVLVERKILTLEDAVSAVQTAAEVKLAMATDSGESVEQIQSAIDDLFRMMDSFATDLNPNGKGNHLSDLDHNLGSD